MPDLDPDLPRITLEELAEFLEDRAGEFRCPFCGNDALGTAEEGPYLRITNNGPGDQRNRAERFLPLIWLSCQNCGFVSGFLASTFLAWRRSRET